MTELPAMPLAVPPLEGRGFHLVALTVADAPELYGKVVDDPEIARWSSIGRVTDLASTEQWAAARATPARIEWTIRLADDDIAGRVALHRLDLADGTAEIGYGLFQDYRGRGLARAVVDRVTACAFGTLGLRRVELRHALGNTRSCGVANACGYLLEGTMREAFDAAPGGYDDAHLHARLHSD